MIDRELRLFSLKEVMSLLDIAESQITTFYRKNKKHVDLKERPTGRGKKRTFTVNNLKQLFLYLSLRPKRFYMWKILNTCEIQILKNKHDKRRIIVMNSGRFNYIVDVPDKLRLIFPLTH